jgi:molecular chaperone DnaK (HSP70)|tara:strand:+ start:643 stop:981 length:339 start_codon:yes stop_codon:yes gene_type:complete
MKISRKTLNKIIQEELSAVLKEEKKNPKAKKRNRTDPVFDDGSSKVKDDADHFPLGSKNQAKNALSRASQYKTKPSWYEGTLDSLVKAVQRKVKKKYPSIDTTEASAKPGKD